MTPEQQKIIEDKAKAYDKMYYADKSAIMEPGDHWANGYKAALESKDEEVKQFRELLICLKGAYLELGQDAQMFNYDLITEVMQFLILNKQQ